MMAITKMDLLQQRERIQEDLHCALDGIDEDFLDKVDQIIVDRFQLLLNKLEKVA
jgi:hypothetical protein